MYRKSQQTQLKQAAQLKKVLPRLEWQRDRAVTRRLKRMGHQLHSWVSLASLVSSRLRVAFVDGLAFSAYDWGHLVSSASVSNFPK